MSITVKIPAQLRSATDGVAEVTVEGSTVEEALNDLYTKHGSLKDRITDNGELRRFVNVYVGGEDIRFLDGLSSNISEADELTILPAVAGG